MTVLFRPFAGVTDEQVATTCGYCKIKGDPPVVITMKRASMP